MLVIAGFTGPVRGPERETSVGHTVPALPDFSYTPPFNGKIEHKGAAGLQIPPKRDD